MKCATKSKYKHCGTIYKKTVFDQVEAIGLTKCKAKKGGKSVKVLSIETHRHMHIHTYRKLIFPIIQGIFPSMKVEVLELPYIIVGTKLVE